MRRKDWFSLLTHEAVGTEKQPGVGSIKLLSDRATKQAKKHTQQKRNE
jgi:hypothetical protein